MTHTFPEPHHDEGCIKCGGFEGEPCEPPKGMTTPQSVEEIDICPTCGGHRWVPGTEAGHGCDGTDEDCLRTCPIAIQVQVGCDDCGGTGLITT